MHLPFRIFLLSALTLGLLTGSASAVHADDGNLDPVIDSNGIAVTDIDGKLDMGRAVTILNDGKILATGSAIGTSINDVVFVTRYNTNGSLDSDFSIDGIVTTDIDNGYDFGFDIVAQNNGKLLVAGEASHGGTKDILLLRYTSSGFPDDTFGTAGIVLIGILTNADTGNAMTLQEDGKVLVTGYTYFETDMDIVFLRYQNTTSIKYYTPMMTH